MAINRNGFLVQDERNEAEPRTYACADKEGLEILISKLTGRELGSFVESEHSFSIPRIRVAKGLHIYSSD
jgi:hypothetical protein